MKSKSWFLLLVFGVSLLPLTPVLAEEVPLKTFEDALALAYASHSILLGEVDEEEAARARGGLMAPARGSQADEGKAALGSLIHATKQQRNSLDDKCRGLKAAAKAEDAKCKQQVLNDYCSAQRAKLNRRIGLLHKLRGDQRKLFTRLWHSIKRSGDRIWHAVGPVGRRILRRAGQDALKIAESGGSLSLSVVKQILIRHAVDVGVEELDRLVTRGIDRFLFGQVALARAAGVQNCTEEDLKKAKERLKSEVDIEPEEEEEGENLPVFGIQNELVSGYASVEWENFIHIAAAEGYSPAQPYTRAVMMDMIFNIKGGTFSGSVSGDLHGKEFSHEEWGSFAVSGITGTIKENPQGSGYLLNGTGQLDVQVRMEQTYTDGAGKAYFYEHEDQFSSPIQIEGKIMILNVTWELDMNGRFDDGTKSFSVNTNDLELGTWQP
ncbi:MAG: hypothetical protein R6U57_05500 [Anaerolineales bacterium]